MSKHLPDRKYDFETMLNRYNVGSGKWEDMRKYGVTEDMNIIPMSNAEMEFFNPPEVTNGLCEYIGNTVMAYFQPIQGYFDAIIGWMKARHRWDIRTEWVIPYPGIHGALCTILEAFTKEGDGVIVMPPTWPGFFHGIEVTSRIRVDNPLIKTGDSYEIDFADLEEKAKDPNTKLLFFCSPHNPVGRVWKKDELERVGRICIDNDVIIVSDEAHSDIIMPGFRHIPFASISPELSDKVITCTAPSKTFNLAGLYTSNIIAANEKYREMIQRQKGKIGVFRPNMLGMKACELAYSRAGEWLDQCVAKIYENSQYVKGYIEANMPMLKISRFEGSYLMWVDMNSLSLEYEELDRALMEDAHVFFDGGHYFGDEGQGYQRINIACPTEAVVDAMKRLDDLIVTLDLKV